MTAPKDVRLAFRFLLEAGEFKVSDPLHAPEHFGNFLVVLESPKIRVRIVKDREQFFVDLGACAEPDEWFDLGIVLDLLDNRAGKRSGFHFLDGGKCLYDLDELARTLQNSFGKIQDLFNPRNYTSTKVKLIALRKRRAEAMFGPAGKRQKKAAPRQSRKKHRT